MNGVQVRNLFYVKNLITNDSDVANPGDAKFIYGTNKINGKTYGQVRYVNPVGEVLVSDFIIQGQCHAEAVEGEGKALKEAVLALTDAPVAGEDYIVDILVHNYQTISDNSTLTKFGAVHAKTNMTTHEFMWRLAKSFVLNFRRDEKINKFFSFYIAEWDGSAYSNEAEVTFNSAQPGSWDTAAEYCIIVRELEQPTWYRGTFPKETVMFDLAPHTIIADGDEVQPFVTVGESGLVEITETATVVPNGYDMADLEYLCHGEIGDQLREVNYPRNIRTKYTITDEDVTKMFDALEIYFYYVGRNTSPEKAEKEFTLVIDHAGTGKVNGVANQLTFSVLETLAETINSHTFEGHEERITELENA